MFEDFIPLDQISQSALETLLDGAFGTERHLRTAYRVRDGVDAIADLSFALCDSGGDLLGSIQCWPVSLRCADAEWPLIMLGPVAVHPQRQNAGIGRALVREVLRRCDGSPLPGADALMLIGDPDYYGRWFGFTAGRTAKWRLPGPFERHRLLARGDSVPDCAGDLGPRRDRSGLQPAPGLA
ncbi:GNAT family N-acetyltransferase [Stakelama marina]|uniref:N-acetyltransferase n=1 Tax=Stakelama marina TaxID=2826939 RepID=A0A8T4IAD3_9SPHN|nr:N-acetyltransferase [Stakelama marina]MBR0551321.1 N-acetyltransferase [Stakelama marina]